MKCSVCGRHDKEGSDGGRRVGYVAAWNDIICFTCAVWRSLTEIRLENKTNQNKTGE